jgi:peptide/nickel transport system substrate-binding protein
VKPQAVRGLALAAAALLLVSCAAKERRESAAGEGAAADSVGPPKTLVWGLSVQPDLLNPLLSTASIATEINDLVFLKLTDFGPPPAHEFVPSLAKSWSLSEDGRMLTYELRDDIRWEDGRPTTAKDVVFTFECMTNPDIAYPRKSFLRKIESCTAAGDWMVSFRFKETPTEPVFETQFHVLPEHILRKILPADLPSSLFNRAPVGNGRWRVTEWVSDEKLVLEAMESPLGRPSFDRIVFRVIPEDNTLRTELLTGGVHVYHRFPSRFYREDAVNPALSFQKFSDRTYTYIGWNHKSPLFQDVRVRKALTMAVDRETIVKAFRDGFGQVAAVPLYAEHADYNPKVKPLPFDPKAAAQLLDEAGWASRAKDGIRMKDGRRFEFTFHLISGNTISEEIATMLQQEFGKLGIGVSSNSMEWTVYLDKLHKKDFDATILARRGDFIYDPEAVFHSRSIEGQYNDISCSIPELDRLIDLAKSIPDREERRKVWWQFQETFARETPVTILYIGDALYPVRVDAVENPAMDLRGALVRVHEWRPAKRPPA